MTKDEFRPLFRQLTVALPPRARTKEELQDLFDTYFKALSVLTADQLERAVLYCLDDCEKFPTIAEIKRHAGEGAGLTNVSAPVANEAVMMAPLNFLTDYAMCKAEGCPGLSNPDRCDGTLGGTVPRGCCGWERYRVYESIAWLRRTGKTIPQSVVRWMAEHGLLAGVKQSA